MLLVLIAYGTICATLGLCVGVAVKKWMRG